MRRSRAIPVILLVLGLAAIPAAAETWVLWDWSANINGATYNPPGLPPSVNASGFDFSTGLGSLTFSVNTPGPNYVGVYFYHFYDYFDMNADLSNGYGTAVGVPPAGLTWEMAWPATGVVALFDRFASSALDNTNSVPAYSAPPQACCSVAMAELLAFTLDPNYMATITFNVSTTAPPGGFYLQSTNYDWDQSIYLTESYHAGPVGPQVPEPSSLVLLASGIAGMAGVMRRRWLS